jgi:hypothetical protein
MKSRNRAVARAVGLLAFASLALTPQRINAQATPAAPSAGTTSLDQVRASLEKYQDPFAAIRDGYFSTLGCIAFNAGGHEGMGHEMTMQYKPGGMGVHFVNMGNVGPALDPMKPQVLIYEPVGDRLKLAAAEWFMPMQLAPNGPPSILGKSLEGPMEGHQPILPAELYHYDLHVWLWKQNPYGTFSPTNPNLKCPAGPYSFQDGPPKMVKGAGSGSK